MKYKVVQSFSVLSAAILLLAMVTGCSSQMSIRVQESGAPQASAGDTVNTLELVCSKILDGQKETRREENADGTYRREDVLENGIRVVNLAVPASAASGSTHEQYLADLIRKVGSARATDIEVDAESPLAGQPQKPLFEVEWEVNESTGQTEAAGVAIRDEQFTYLFFFSGDEREMDAAEDQLDDILEHSLELRGRQ